nr:unnamed protein product [Callosobruchus analis]
MIIDPSQSKELVKKALFGEVMQEQIGKNYYLKAATRQEKSCYKKLLSGPTADKYKLWRLGSSAITYKRLGYNKSRTETKGYSLFCRLRPFWVVPPKLTDRDTCACIVHENIDLKLSALKHCKILGFSNYQSVLQIVCCDRYAETCLLRKCNSCSLKTLPYAEFDNRENISVKQWSHGRETIIDQKTKKERYVTKYKKETKSMKPRDLVMQLEIDLQKLFQHEQSIKLLKQSLTDNDAIIHMDFSENFNTKCNQEIQAYHFGGSRTQISMHTVIVYTKASTTSHCTISLNLAHNVGAIWAHLTPVLISLPSTVQNLHFLSDGPVTQYRNKAMFFMLACKMQEFYPNVTAFSWNYHEAGHGKGAPDGVGATCKRTADKVIAQKTDITDLYGFADVLRENCSGIKISVIEEADIEGMNNLIKENESNLKSFKGTLMVHQVTSHIHQPNRLVMTSLSCFCSITCNHYTLGSLEYRNKSNHLDVAVSTDSEDDVPLEKLRRGEATHASTSDSNYPAVSHVSTDSEDDVPLQKLRRIKATHASTSNPHRLEVSDVYTDSEDDVPLQNLLNHLKYKI